MICTPFGERRRARDRRRGADATPWRALPARSGHYVRVDLARLDELMRMIGDLVILRARLADTLARSRARTCPPARLARRCRRTPTAIERELRELREGVMRVRLVPVGEIFRRMPFVVRDLARDSGPRGQRRARAGRTPRSTSSWSSA